jgi:1,4-alpha-glucan branching enzyme
MNSGLDFQVSMPAASSWGAYGYSDSWLNHRNGWIWPHLHHAVREMAEMARTRANAQGIERRALNQLAREVLLASSSDWPFIITMGTTVSYAERRFRDHIHRFNFLLDQIHGYKIDECWLATVENRDKIFPNIDFCEFAAHAMVGSR